jgi:hypothetical protein
LSGRRSGAGAPEPILKLEPRREPRGAEHGDSPQPTFPSGEAPRTPVRRTASLRASLAGTAAALVTAAIYLGSRGLRYFDAALVGYATATVMLAFGVVYRYTVWVSSPPASRYLRRGWQAFFSWRNFRRLPTAVPRSLVTYLGLQTFIAARGRAAGSPTSCCSGGGAGHPDHLPADLRLVRVPVRQRHRAGLHGLLPGLPDGALRRPVAARLSGLPRSDLAAVMVLAGCGYFLWRRFRHREATTGQRFGYDFFPLVGLVAISVTGLLLTLAELAAGGPRLRLPGHRPHGHGGADAGVHPVREVLPRHPAPG